MVCPFTSKNRVRNSLLKTAAPKEKDQKKYCCCPDKNKNNISPSTQDVTPPVQSMMFQDQDHPQAIPIENGNMNIHFDNILKNMSANCIQKVANICNEFLEEYSLFIENDRALKNSSESQNGSIEYKKLITKNIKHMNSLLEDLLASDLISAKTLKMGIERNSLTVQSILNKISEFKMPQYFSGNTSYQFGRSAAAEDLPPSNPSILSCCAQTPSPRNRNLL